MDSFHETLINALKGRCRAPVPDLFFQLFYLLLSLVQLRLHGWKGLVFGWGLLDGSEWIEGFFFVGESN